MPVLDTPFLIAVERGDPAAGSLFRHLTDEGGPLLVPAAVWTEYLSALPQPAQKRAERILGRAVQFAPFDRRAADQAVLLQSRLLDEGRRLAWHDLQVAATALLHREAIVTLDAGFDGIEGLERMHP